jgi:hypothetical protein
LLRNLYLLVLSLLLVFGVEKVLRFWWLWRFGVKLTLIVDDTYTEIYDSRDRRVLKASNRVELVLRDHRPSGFASIWGEQGKLFEAGMKNDDEVRILDLVQDPVMASEEFRDCWGGFLRSLCDLARQSLNVRTSRTLQLQVVTRTSNAETNRKIEQEIQNPVLQAFGHFRIFENRGRCNVLHLL